MAQLADMCPRHEWEEIAACCDATICLGVNDPTSAKFISEKCGMTTIQVTNNQSPQTPLLSPLQNNIRPYSMTRSNTQRALMQPDEVLRLDNAQCLVLLRGQYPMLLYKITPEEFAAFAQLRSVSITDYPAVQPEDDAEDTPEEPAPPQPPEQTPEPSPEQPPDPPDPKPKTGWGDLSSLPRYPLIYPDENGYDTTGTRGIRLSDAQVDAIQGTLDTMRNDEKTNYNNKGDAAL